MDWEERTVEGGMVEAAGSVEWVVRVVERGMQLGGVGMDKRAEVVMMGVMEEEQYNQVDLVGAVAVEEVEEGEESVVGAVAATRK